MSADDDDELDEFASMRGLFASARSSMFDEEPAPRIDALLLAAARQHAPKPRAPWWARLADWMRPAFAHPALAGAAALVIVGGTAGVMYARGQRVKVAGPTVEVARTAPARDPLPAPPAVAVVPTEPTAAGPDEAEQVGEADGDQAGDKLDGDRPTGGAVRRAERGNAPGSGVASGPATSAATTGAATAGTAPRAEGGRHSTDDGKATGLLIAEGPTQELLDLPADGTLAQQRDDQNFSATVVGGVGRAPIASPEKNTVKPEPPAPPPPPPPPIDRTVVEDRAPSAGDEVAGTDRSGQGQSAAARNRAQVEQLLGQARTAARANNCAVVKTIATRVKKLDAAYYRDVFARDPDLARCR